MGRTAKADGVVKRKRQGKTKDPNAPKRALTAFFLFSNDERAKVKSKFPDYGIGDIAKELGARWANCPNRDKYEAMALKEKERYTKDMAAYEKGGKKPTAGASSSGPAAKKAAKKPVGKKAKHEDDDDDEDENDDEESD